MTFPSRDWPTAPPGPPSPFPQHQTVTKRLLKRLRPSGVPEAKLGKRKASALFSPSPPSLIASCYRSASNSISYLRLDTAAAAAARSGGEEDGCGDAGGRRLLRRAQQADIAANHRRRRGRLRHRAVPRRRASRPGILGRPCAAGRVDVGATGLHVVPPRRQLQQQQRQWRPGCQDVAAAVRQQGHRGVHPPLLAGFGALQEEGKEQERLQRQGAGAGGEHPSSRRAHEELCLTAIFS